jgi:bis(5'-nucleosyl)-tetraphosphatase (symmetrical)
MATYVVGDVQGCWGAFQRLLAILAFNPQKDHMLFAGDLIARGEDSTAIMRWVLDHEDACSAVLGNHDLNFLAVASGIRGAKSKDKTNRFSIHRSVAMSFIGTANAPWQRIFRDTTH